MEPVIAIVGRPNVGKSTIFNKLTRSRDAIVANFSGLTRDRQYGEGNVEGRHFIVIDTGGLAEEEHSVDSLMVNQSLAAIEEADVVLFVVDARAGVMAGDLSIAKHLRKIRGKSVYLVANKSDGLNADIALAEFYSLGLGDPIATAAAHNHGIKPLIEYVLDALPAEQEVEEFETTGPKIAVLGRPNVGKSTLVNRMLGEERVVVFDMPGTTRDSIYIPYERNGKPYTLIDTAGVRRRGKVKESVEKFSVIKALQAIDDSNVVVLVLDAAEGIVDQDLHLLGFALERGRSIVIAVNKWDGLETYHKDGVKREVKRRLHFVEYAKVHYISALHGTGVGDLYGSIDKAYQSANLKVSASLVTRYLEDAVAAHQPPAVNGRRIKLRFAHYGGTNPPSIIIHGNQTESIPETYRSYLENSFRSALKLVGTPVRIIFKTGDNPYETRKGKLTRRQELYKNKKEKRKKH
ncbi:MAG: ribosome biogenesis GTPase Der [Pseudomonadales bacterium]|nr:ribosome biogenesis GTPase Der [Pseudomonadales bacterium]